MFKESNKIPILVLISTALVAFFCDIKTINAYLAPMSDEDTGGPMAMLYLISVIAIFFFGIFFLKKREAIPINGIFLISYICLFYIFTALFIAPPHTDILFFGVFTISSFLIPFVITIDTRWFLKFLMLFSVPAILKVNEIFVFVYSYADVLSMGTCYAFLTPILATIIYLFTFFKNESLFQKIVTIVLSIVNGVFASYLITFGSRGPVFAIIVTILYMTVVKYNHESGKIELKKGRMFIYLLAAIIIGISFIPLLVEIQNVLSQSDISLNFINKFINKFEAGSISNGRDEVLELAWNDIKNNPIFGMGFDQYFNNHGTIAPYPHNFLVQILYDGGLLFFFIMIIPLWKSIKTIIASCSYDDFILFSALFFTSVPRAMFSGNLWSNGPLWMFFGALLCKTLAYNSNSNGEIIYE